MKKNYISPEIEITRFDTDDIICTSTTPVAETLITEGAGVGDEKMSNLLMQ